MIRPVVRYDSRTREQFRGLTRDAARRTARAELEALGQRWEEEVVQLVRAEAPRRDGERHKTNTTHLENSFTHRVSEGGDQGFPMTLDLTIKPGVSARKIAALEFGVDREYEIVARNTKRLRWGEHPGDLGSPFKKVVWKPTGQIRQGFGFMRRARDTILARRRGGL